MHNTHARNTVRYYIILIVLLSFLFLSNDFGLIDVQKTAIVVAVGIDKEEDEFLLTSQIAVPKNSDSGGASEAVQLVSRGKTVAEAFEAINAKTGWYPKLVFCKLILLGKKTAEENVFDALDFFLRDEYLSDDCQLAVCEKSAKELLNTSALIDPSSSEAMSKVLSPHAERVGTVHPVNLKDFSIGYFSDSQSGALPVLKTEPQQEKSKTEEAEGSGGGSSSEEGGGSSQDSSSSQNEESLKSGGGSTQEKSGEKDKPVFSARETALFVRGRWLDTLTAEETFAVNAATGKLRLASYSVDLSEGRSCTLSVKQNLPKISLDVNERGRGELKIDVRLVAGVLDYSKAQDVKEIKDMGNPPSGSFAAAEKKLQGSLITAYEKGRAIGCDLFGVQERLVKYKKRRYAMHKDTLLNDTTLSVHVKITSVR